MIIFCGRPRSWFWKAVLIAGFFVLCIFGKELVKKPGLNVTEKINLTKDIKADQNDVFSYRKFIKSNKQYQKPISEAVFQNQIKCADYYLIVHPSGKIAGDLKGRIVQELNIDFLLEGLDERKLEVSISAARQRIGYTEKELLFVDPRVGPFSALLLIPDKKKPCPAVVGLHGHGGSGKSFRDHGFGADLAKEGFVVIMPSFRAMRFDESEEAISRELYLNGFTLMGIRVYETLLLIKYLKYKDFVNENRIGIIGHSGGSTVACLVSRISPDLRAGVYDMFSGFYDEIIHCETIPGMVYYAPQINNLSTLKIPFRKFEYAYTGQYDKQEALDFFKKNLTGDLR